MRRQETGFVCFGSSLGLILVPQSLQNRSQIKPKPSNIELGKPFWFQARPGGAPGVPWVELGVSRASFWDDFEFQNSSKIDEKSIIKNDAF